jgi:polyhydroxyalkanoate synthesis regulator phasin
MAEEKHAPMDPAGVMESAIMMGIGLMEVTREKVGELTDELIERGRMSQSEAKRVAERVTEAAGRQQDTMRTTIAEETRKAMDAAGLVNRDEIEALRAEIAELKEALAAAKPTGSAE